MRLRKFKKEAKRNRKKILITLIVILGILTSILISRTYAFFQKENEVTFINAKVGKFVEKDIELAMKLDGKAVTSPPAKNSYTTTVTCDNATGTWDKDKWGALITNIKTNRVKCEVNFTTPKATLSTVTATPDKTTINLSYTAGGIGTSTTCVYGKTNSYGSSASSVTNSKCSITGLSMDTTYYYKVCAKNVTGEVCNTGSIKTKPEWILAEHVNVGDYISMTPTATSYTISRDLTGYTSDQTINPSELKLWRVIRKNSDGTVDMVSDKVSSTLVYFREETGYLNFVGGLNTIASQYTDGKHVQSTRHMGYSNQTEKCTKLSSSACPADTGYLTDLELVNIAYGGESGCSNRCTSLIGKISTGEREYWISSRAYDSAYKSPYRGRYIDIWGTVSAAALIGNGETISPRRSVRPIATLKSASEIKSGTGSASSPYILV